jgi:HK97 family phage major capsid protein
MHPTDYETVRLGKDANGNYIFGPPNSAAAITMWGLPIVRSTLIGQGTALVGAYRQAATLWVREGIAISATDSHSDWFIRNVTAIKADMRVAFAVTRPTAFCTVTGL